MMKRLSALVLDGDAASLSATSDENRMVSSSTKKPKKVLIDPESNGYEEPKKRNRITWTMDLHEKFLEAVKALGGNDYATPDAILQLMNIKGLTAKHVGSHLQKHRLRHQNAKQGGQRQENATRKPFPELKISTHYKATSESITPRVETDGEVYPLRLGTKMKKSSVDTVALKTDIYSCTTKSLWDRYENKLQRAFSEKKKRWQFMSEHKWPGKNNIVITDEENPNEAPETAGGASIEIYGSSSLLASDQVGENSHSESARANANMGDITLLEGYDAFTEISGSSNMLTNNQVGEKNHTKFAARDNEHMENINLLEVYEASIKNGGSSSLLTCDQVGQNNLTKATRNNDTMGNINSLEGIMDKEYNASMDFSIAWADLESNDLDLIGPSNGLEDLRDNACNDALRSVGPINVDEPVTQGSQGQQNLGMEDLQQVDDIAWDDALISVGLVNLLDEPMTEEAVVNVGGSQDQQSPASEVLQAGNNAWDDDLRSAGMVNLLNDEAIAQEVFIGDALMDDLVSPIAQDDSLWAWSPAMPADYDTLF